MDKSEELLERCFKCKDYPNDCGIYFMMSLWEKECKFFRENDKVSTIFRETRNNF